MPKVAVCLAVFNGICWLQEQLDSIFSQRDVLVTVFVSVDRSSDGSEEWIDLVAEKNSRIIVLPHGGYFGGAANNFFRLLREVDFSGFDYVCLADQDDIWLPEKLKRAHHILSGSDAHAYSGNVTAFWPDGRQAFINKSQKQKRWDYLFEAAGPGCTYVFKMDLVHSIQTLLTKKWDQVQGVDLHDWFFYAYARANGYQWFIDEYSGMLYRQHGGNQVGVNAGFSALFGRARKVLNGGGLSQAALIARLVGLGGDPFVLRWASGSRLGLLWLVLHAGQCRRRLRDRVLFALSCLALFLVPRRCR